MTMAKLQKTPASAPANNPRARGGLLKAAPIAVYFPSNDIREKCKEYAASMKPKRSLSAMLLEALEDYMIRNPQPKTKK